MDNKKRLIDDICNDNNYLLSFQATTEAQNLAKVLIVLRDNKINDINDANNINDVNNVKSAIEALIVLLNSQILNLGDEEHSEVHLDYLNEILNGLLKSQNRFT